MRGIAGRQAVVSGGAGGIGQAIVERLRAEGADVTILDLRAPGDCAGLTSAIQVDVADAQAVARELAARELRPDIAVNVAGIFEW